MMQQPSERQQEGGLSWLVLSYQMKSRDHRLLGRMSKQQQQQQQQLPGKFLSSKLPFPLELHF
jgi:hypothetical protein